MDNFCPFLGEFSMWPIKMIFLLHRLGFMTASILKQLKHMLLMHSADKEGAKNILTRLLPSLSSAPESLAALTRTKIHLVAPEGIKSSNLLFYDYLVGFIDRFKSHKRS